MSRRDVAHVLNALWNLGAREQAAGVREADIDAAVGRGEGDMRTPLNLRSCSDDDLAVRLPDGTWALTPRGVDWVTQDRELSDR